MSVKIKQYAPADSLKPYIEYYWEGTFVGSPSAAFHHQVIPTGYIDFILHFSDARCEVKTGSDWQGSSRFYLSGFWTTPFWVQFWDTVVTFNIRFKPEALFILLNLPASELLNRPNNLEEVFGSHFNTFFLQLEAVKTVEEKIQLADQFFLKKLSGSKKNNSYLQLASEIIRLQRCEISVERLSDEVCISSRQLEREFKNKLGISPKTYMRITRINMVQELVTNNPTLNQSQLAYLAGYSDQAHFIKDFKKLTGVLPSGLVSDPTLLPFI